MADRGEVIKGLNDIHAVACGLGDDQCFLNGIGVWQLQALIDAATELLKAQAETINDLYGMYDGLCKEIREKYESDDVCGLCQYDGAYVGESGDWMNECPGFETNECFCMKNSIREMCGQPLIEEP